MRSKSRILLAATGLAAALLPFAAHSQDPGDAKQGLTFALSHCAECHAVTAAQEKSPNPAAPSFSSVAHTSGMTGTALAAWLQTSHPTMPNLIINAEDRHNIIAYILSLKPLPPQ
jgi:mono/diheme cytochrome c family protein